MTFLKLGRFYVNLDRVTDFNTAAIDGDPDRAYPRRTGVAIDLGHDGPMFFPDASPEAPALRAWLAGGVPLHVVELSGGAGIPDVLVLVD